MSIKVYRYGLLPPIENAERVKEQMVLGHRYRNMLVEIERHRRAAVREIYGQELAEAEESAKTAKAAVKVAIDSVNTYKALHRTRKVPDELAAALKQAKVAKKEAVTRFNAARAALRNDPQLEQKVATIEDRATQLIKSARAHHSPFWGSYLQVEQAHAAVRAMPLYRYGEPNDPRFVPWCGFGFCAVQLQGGLPIDEMVSDTRLRIEPGSPPPNVSRTSKRAARRQYLTLAMRIGSDGKDPVWARWPLVMHRPLPKGAVIKWARVRRCMIGPREEWSVAFTLDMSNVKKVSQPTNRADAVAVDIGWRVVNKGIAVTGAPRHMDGELRVCAWQGTDGRGGTLHLSHELLSALTKAESLRSIRDRNFNEVKERLAPFKPEVPWWPTNMWQWRSAARLAKLVRKWTANRFDGDDEFYLIAEKWRYQDHHLWEWETSQRIKAIRRREDLYRNFAAKLSREYAEVVLEGEGSSAKLMDMRPLALRESTDNERARSNRVLASCSTLRKYLTETASKVTFVPAPNTTRMCQRCESVEHWDQAAEVWHDCSKCGASWDQDQNAAANMLRLSLTPTASSVDIAAAKDSRWSKVKKAKAEKLAARSADQADAAE